MDLVQCLLAEEERKLNRVSLSSDVNNWRAMFV